MAKRVAGKQMTQDNWNEEDEQEEAGVFKMASENVMKERKVIKPRRKLGETGGEAGSGGAFKGFGGFGAAKPSTGGPGLFSFGTGTTKPLSGLANGSETKPSTEFKLGSFQASQAQTNSSSDTKEEKESDNKPKTATNGVGKSDSAAKSKYLHQLKCLNEGVTKWIKQHVDKNPYCILTPIFKDYEKHLADIEKQNPDNDKSKETNDTVKKEEKKEETKPLTTTSSESQKPPVMSSTFSFGTSATKTTSTSSSSTTSSAGTSLFSFGASKTSPPTTGTSVFGGAAASGGATGFSFGSGSTGIKPFSFATGATGGASSSADNEKDSAGGDDEEYVPPKTEVSEIKEEDSLYSKRCKMYYNKEGTWIEKGVGNLHLKPCSGKTQLLIRADTNLGNILLNIMLNSQIPFARQGKNNVTFMCVPNPPLDPKDTDAKPSSILLRVKTGDDADELLENINKHKGE